MISSFRGGKDSNLSQFMQEGARVPTIPASIESALSRKLSVIDSATKERDLFNPRSNNYERLSGTLDGWSSIRVNIHWRLIFQWRDGCAYEIYLDPHKY
ncbi:type II toxin-antitoxin system RelE/ParE family toxin [Nissabacter sp. SGAir0207]|uniref:type II toxin-antitoxin system RelE/ParE family toxin n=1 Tax=Nissabacter sp. SGAir0207 TaxID=2126321 RepID=UPI0010CD3FE2|nr:type II toxin-antitoxin system RelE/ParE family toxin [Nissabacter sp. SGAir0207]QCR38710.1 toxin [Nissabacter sp. SGAir0207]